MAHDIKSDEMVYVLTEAFPICTDNQSCCPCATTWQRWEHFHKETAFSSQHNTQKLPTIIVPDHNTKEVHNHGTHNEIYITVILHLGDIYLPSVSNWIPTMRHMSDLNYDLWLTRCTLLLHCAVWMPRLIGIKPPKIVIHDTFSNFKFVVSTILGMYGI